MTDADLRLSRMLNAALHSPDFGLRLLAQAPAPERAELVRRWTQLPESPATEQRPPRPGLRKCGTRTTQSHELALQLAAFARSVR